MSDRIAFLDANVLVYHLVQPDHPHSGPSSALLARVRTGQETVFVSSTAVAEVVFVCTRVYGAANEHVAIALREIMSSPGVRTDHPEALTAALDFWATQGPLSFADCFHLALAKSLGIRRLYSFDKRMNRYPGVTRVEPA